MNIRNKSYMKSEEFKKRQTWLPFTDALGIVLQVLEEVKAKAWEWFKEWAKKPAKVRAKNTTGFLDFTRKTSNIIQLRRTE